MVSETQRDRQLPSLSAVVQHHWVLIVVITLIGIGAGTLYAGSLERSYTASAVVLLNPLAANPLAPEATTGSGAQLNVALETEAEVVTTPAIAEVVSQRLGRLVPEDGEYLDVGVPPGTQMVRIAFTSGSADSAREGAQAFAEVYLDYREDRAGTSVESSLETLRAEAAGIEERLRSALGAAEDDSFAAREADLFVDRLAVVNDRISSLESTMTDPGQVLQPARDPSIPNELGGPVIQGAAGLLALVLAVLLAWYREWRSGLVGEKTATEIVGLPVFATVPTHRQAAAPESVHEAYRHLRVGVTANALRPHTLAVRAIGAQADAPVVATNLAIALAEARYSVLLVAADPESRRVETLLDIEVGSPGLAEVLSDDVDVDEVLVSRRGMVVLPGGRPSGSSREYFAGPQLRRVLEKVRGSHDFIIMVTAGSERADGDAVTAAADSVLLVLRTRESTQMQVGNAVERIERLGVDAMGAVVVSGGDDATLIAPPLSSTTRHREPRVRI